jgi:NADH-quinone oxidoreductase subunit K
MIPVTHYLILTVVLFSLSLVGIILNRRNVILLLVCVELMLLAVNTNFVAFSHYYGGSAGEVFVFFILTVAAAEAAIGLAIVMLLYRNRENIDVSKMNHLKG